MKFSLVKQTFCFYVIVQETFILLHTERRVEPRVINRFYPDISPAVAAGLSLNAPFYSSLRSVSLGSSSAAVHLIPV